MQDIKTFTIIINHKIIVTKIKNLKLKLLQVKNLSIAKNVEELKTYHAKA